MSAGESAGQQADRLRAVAVLHQQAAVDALDEAARYELAAVTEKRTARALSPLGAIGYHLLADRRWPGTRRAQVDLVVVGPGGVFIVDTKAWRDVQIVMGRVYQGQDDVTDELMTLTDLLDTTQADLAEAGLAAGEVRVIVVLAGRSGVDANVEGLRVVGERDILSAITSYRRRLTTTQVETVLARALQLFPPVGAPAPVVASVPEPVLPAPSDQIDPTGLLSAEEVNQALLEGQLAAPIEEWMAFLHPQQARVVRRSYSGPSRIRGPAGTGKTVVGLHRAAHLARTRPGRILVTTYVRTLPDVLSSLLTRFAPEVVERVEFTGIHRFANRLLRDRGIQLNLNAAAADEAFDQAWSQADTTALGTHAHDRRYWREEIGYVLKGRGLTSYDEYADLVRTGRRRALQPSQRRAVWQLYEGYTAELRRRRVHDFEDAILLAEAELRRQPLTDQYAGVIVDEAQDLTCAMIRLLHGLVGDRPDGLTLVGDGQQSIYPGGYTLAEAGISIAGRGVVFDINYRNTAQIVALASRLVDDDEYPDIEGVMSRGENPSSVLRTGSEPDICWYSRYAERDSALISRIRQVTAVVGTGTGDVGVLCNRRKVVDHIAGALRAAQLPVVTLEEYDGSPTDAIKVGTIKRAKGLEFKQVLIPDVSPSQTENVPPSDAADYEAWRLARRELYVGMTRARDGLWVGIHR